MAAIATIGVGLWSIAWLVAEVLYIREFILLFHGGYGLLGLAIAACGYQEWRSARGQRP